MLSKSEQNNQFHPLLPLMIFDKNLHEKKLSAQEMGGGIFFEEKKRAPRKWGGFFWTNFGKKQCIDIGGN